MFSSSLRAGMMMEMEGASVDFSVRVSTTWGGRG